ncbi:hypothetical protein EDB19DRAFT_2037310 [Suillus lakei]|nr:hypothetical protein EDB19DRAFT_2037310 [Suillus lakei]
MPGQNPEPTPVTLTKPIRSYIRKPRTDLGHASVPKPAVAHRKLQLLPRSVHAADPSGEEPGSAMSEAEAKKKIDEDVRVLRDDYFAKLPHEHRFRLVDKLVASALESKETDARLVSHFFAQATSNGQCTLKVFEEGFMPIAEFLDDIAIDAPKAFDYMAIMLRGAGFENEHESLQRIASKLEDSDKLFSMVA